MENKKLYEKEFDKKIKSLKVEEESLTLCFDDSTKISFSTYHDQDCCEHVYGDFSISKYHETELTNHTLYEIDVKSVHEMGFLLCFSLGYKSTKIFIPCHNYQNGCYSSDLKLDIENDGIKTTLDISDCVEDPID